MWQCWWDDDSRLPHPDAGKVLRDDDVGYRWNYASTSEKKKETLALSNHHSPVERRHVNFDASVIMMKLLVQQLPTFGLNSPELNNGNETTQNHLWPCPRLKAPLTFKSCVINLNSSEPADTRTTGWLVFMIGLWRNQAQIPTNSWSEPKFPHPGRLFI